jgi:hypothetical protein
LQELNDEQLAQVTGALGVSRLSSQVFPSVLANTNVYANAYAYGANIENTFATASSVIRHIGGGTSSLSFGFSSAFARS